MYHMKSDVIYHFIFLPPAFVRQTAAAAIPLWGRAGGAEFWRFFLNVMRLLSFMALLFPYPCQRSPLPGHRSSYSTFKKTRTC